MKPFLKPLVASAAILIAGAAFASDDMNKALLLDDLKIGTELGMDQATIKSGLEALGYDVRKIDSEDGMIEAYVVKDRTIAEVYVDPKTGAVVRVSQDD